MSVVTKETTAEKVKKMEKLKPCPFCGGEAKLYREQNHGGFDGSVVRCENCGAKGEWAQMNYIYGCDEAAREAWNRRVNNMCETCSMNPNRQEEDE